MNWTWFDATDTSQHSMQYNITWIQLDLGTMLFIGIFVNLCNLIHSLVLSVLIDWPFWLIIITLRHPGDYSDTVIPTVLTYPRCKSYTSPPPFFRTNWLKFKPYRNFILKYIPSISLYHELFLIKNSNGKWIELRIVKRKYN